MNKERYRRKRMKSKKVFALLMCALVMTGFSGCMRQITEEAHVTIATVENPETTTTATMAESGEAASALETEETEVPFPASLIENHYLEGYDTFDVTSSDLENGVWNDIISNSKLGENCSPELSWEAVEGAGEYAIYMVDRNSNGFLHWKADGIKEAGLPRGQARKLVEYNGPHLGHGYTHVFDVYVIALRAPAGKLGGCVNAVNPKMNDFFLDLDTDAEGNTGNIIAYGKVSGQYTDARFRDGVLPTDEWYQ